MPMPTLDQPLSKAWVLWLAAVLVFFIVNYIFLIRRNFSEPDNSTGFSRGFGLVMIGHVMAYFWIDLWWHAVTKQFLNSWKEAAFFWLAYAFAFQWLYVLLAVAAGISRGRHRFAKGALLISAITAAVSLAWKFCAP